MFRSMELRRYLPNCGFFRKFDRENVAHLVVVGLGNAEDPGKRLPCAGLRSRSSYKGILMSGTKLRWRVVGAALTWSMAAAAVLSCGEGSTGASDLGVLGPDLGTADAAALEVVQVSAVSPSGGGTAGGTAITLTGSGFRSGALVRVGGTIASSIQVSPDGGSLTCNTPARPGRPGPVDITVTNVSGQSATLSQSFRYFLSTLSFDPPTALVGSDAGPRSVGVADLNKDGSLDLVVVYQTSSTVHSYRNSGSGTFSLASNRSVGSSPIGLTLADVNADGKLDAATASPGMSVVSVLLGDGTGALTSAASSATGGGTQPVAVIALDVNNDGNLDLLTANSTSAASGNLGLLLGNRSATFSLGTAIATSATSLVGLTAIDVNSDGKLDAVGIHRLNQLGVTNVSVLQNRGVSTPPLLTLLGAKTQQVNPSAVGSGDFNRDGVMDVVVASDVAPTGKLTVLMGQAAGALGDGSAASTYDLDGTPTGLAVADLDGDGNLDVICANTSGVSGNLSLLRGKGNGTFSPSQRIDFSSVIRPSAVAVGDFDFDGIVDLVITDQPSVGAGAVLVRRGIGQ